MGILESRFAEAPSRLHTPCEYPRERGSPRQPHQVQASPLHEFLILGNVTDIDIENHICADLKLLIYIWSENSQDKRIGITVDHFEEREYRFKMLKNTRTKF